MTVLVFSLPVSAAEPGPAGLPPVPLVAAPVTEAEKKKILEALKQRFLKEEKDLESTGKIQKKDLVRAQNERKKEWRENERKSRRAFFEAHGSGPERRAYVQDFVKRREAYDHREKVEWTDFKRHQKEAREALENSHRELARKVNEALTRGQRPEGF